LRALRAPAFVTGREMWEIFKEFLRFLRTEKKWWLMPLVFLLLLLGLFLVFSASSPLAPFLYPLF
jgi:uncharacterized protein DUF5989